jgi:hypothetical protein
MGSPSVVGCSKPPGGVAGFLWNRWQLCHGIGGSFGVESVAALPWNQWQPSYGISGSVPVESVAALAWNTQATPHTQTSTTSKQQAPCPWVSLRVL